MKILLLIAVCFAVMFAAGWVTYSENGADKSVTFDSAKAERDTERLVEKSEEIVRGTAEQVSEITSDQ